MSEEDNIDYLSLRSESYNAWYLPWWKKFKNVFDKPQKFKHFWEFLTTNHGNEPSSEE
jgi:hypothetical protein